MDNILIPPKNIPYNFILLKIMMIQKPFTKRRIMMIVTKRIVVNVILVITKNKTPELIGLTMLPKVI